MPNAFGTARLLSLAAHELATPAGVLGGCLKILRLSDPGDPDRRERALAQAERSYERLAELLAEMSDLWRLEAGEAVFNRQPMPIRPVLQDVVRSPAAWLPANVTVHLEADALSNERVMADPGRLRRAFGGLLAAVARHLSEDSTLMIQGLRLDGTQPVVRVIFSDAATTPATVAGVERVPLDEFEGGLGLALPIARRVIEADGGTVCALAGAKPLALIADLPACP
jgi:signal transduction histidine kinase